MPAKISGSGGVARTSMGTYTAIVFIVGFLLIGLNYWHAMKCVPTTDGVASSDAIDIHMASLERRLLASEAQNIKIALVLHSVLQAIQNKYVALSKAELYEIDKNAEKESLKIALGIAAQPPPAMPVFELDPAFQDAEKLSAFIDDFFEKKGTDLEQGWNIQDGANFNEASFDKAGMGQEGGLGLYDDDLFEKKTDANKEEFSEKVTLPEEEREMECSKMKSDYSVVIGVSWGNLPYDLQEMWRAFKCDMFFNGL